MAVDQGNTIARRACGCIVVIAANEIMHRKDVQRNFGEAIAEGCTIERVSTDYIRNTPWRCADHDPKRQPKQMDRFG